MRIKKGTNLDLNRIERFENKIFYSPCGCWLWTAALNRQGYGEFKWDKITQVRANRASYTLYKGKIPSGMNVCHSCDTPLCVNPDHLFLGTQQDNIIDMYSKGRGVDNSGEKNGMSKLSPSSIYYIRESSKHGIKGKDIAEAFNISSSTVSLILNGNRWKTLLKNNLSKL